MGDSSLSHVSPIIWNDTGRLLGRPLGIIQIQVGKDLFDDHVTQFLQKIGEQNIVSINPITYTHLDMATRQWITDYGVLVAYRG